MVLEDQYWKIITGLITIIVYFVIYNIATAGIKKYLYRYAHKKMNVRNFLFLWRTVWTIIASIFILIGFSGSLTALGITAGFLGMVLGWSLQAPVTAVAAWLMIILKRPFKIGDRVIIAGITGDVIDINMTHIVLNQVGGTISGEEKSGRGVLIPNNMLFNQIIHNYTLKANKFILDEVTVLITFESDVDKAEEILINACQEVTNEIIKETKQEPYIRQEIGDSGVRLRLRYKSVAMDRQKTSGDISKKIIKAFNKNKKVRFCYPHTEIVYNKKF